MIRKLLPVLLAIVGLAVGTGVGLALKPVADGENPEPAHADPAHSAEAPDQQAARAEPAPPETPVRRSEQPGRDQESGFEYVKLNNQFVVPVVNGARVAALVVMSLSIEVAAGRKEIVFSREPKLRDSFLQVLFDHANSGGFDGAFTDGEKMRDLRGSLFEAAVAILGPIATDVLVIDIVRQDV